MAMVIIYKGSGETLSVIYPASGSAEDVAGRDVPSGKPYKIIDVTDLPADRTQRMGWTVDDADLTDGVGGIQ